MTLAEQGSVMASHTRQNKADTQTDASLEVDAGYYLEFFGGGGGCGPKRVMVFSFMGSLEHTQRRTTVDRTPLDERSACRRDFYLTTHNNHNTQTSKSSAAFEPAISEGERSQTCALDFAATGSYRGLCYVENHETGSTERGIYALTW